MNELEEGIDEPIEEISDSEWEAFLELMVKKFDPLAGYRPAPKDEEQRTS
jgi:hypothetical protein